jgi:hypothetical protein
MTPTNSAYHDAGGAGAESSRRFHLRDDPADPT